MTDKSYILGKNDFQDKMPSLAHACTDIHRLDFETGGQFKQRIEIVAAGLKEGMRSEFHGPVFRTVLVHCGNCVTVRVEVIHQEGETAIPESDPTD